MRLSVITPLHEPGNRFVLDAYRTLVEQTHADWEWIVLENHGGWLPDEARADRRVRVLSSDADGIGALKRHGCLAAEGQALVELDADDVLAPSALAQVAEAVEGGGDFVYSDFAEFKWPSMARAWAGYPYGARYGWSHYPVTFRGHMLSAMRSPPASAHNLRLVDFAPNHLRAWSRASYLAVGGHDPSLAVADDHDLAVRYYLAGKRFVHLPECLYFYRVHEANTVKTANAQIRAATSRVYDRSIVTLAERFADEHGLTKLDLCSGAAPPEGYRGVDKHFSSARVEQHDLDRPWSFLATSSVGVLRAADAVEHLRDPVHTMNQAYRVLAPGGFLLIDVPASNGLGAFCDPTHVSFWNRLSFRYYTDPAFARYLPAFEGRFQLLRLREWYPSPWHREQGVPYVQAHLAALKDGYVPMGEVLW